MSEGRSLEHPALGVLRETDPDHLPDTYVGTIRLGDHSFGLSVCPDGDQMETAVRLAAYIISEKGAWIAKATQDVSTGLLDEYNTYWSDGAVLNAEAFADKIQITDIQILGAGCLTVMFNDGGLLGGHALVITYFDLSLDLKADIALEGDTSTFG